MNKAIFNTRLSYFNYSCQQHVSNGSFLQNQNPHEFKKGKLPSGHFPPLRLLSFCHAIHESVTSK